MHGVDYYELLGVDNGATDAEIKSAYRAQAKVMHPDTGGTSGTFRLLREAYETLSDPSRRGDYDRGADPGENFEDVSVPRVVRETASARRATRFPAAERSCRARSFGEDPDFMAPAPRLETGSIGWWNIVDSGERVRFAGRDGPGHGPLVLAPGAIFVLVLPIVLRADFSGLFLALWLVLIVVTAAGGYRLAGRYLTVARAQREFTVRFGGNTVFGCAGADDDQWAERLTADLLSEYLARLPGARIFHGLAWPGSVFADVDHAVLAGRRLVLVESKMWLPGHYAAGDGGEVRRNGQRFRGGGSLLAEGIAEFRDLLPGVEVRGALIIYPSRNGEVSAADALDAPAPPMTPDQFVKEIGAWLAQEPSTVDADAFRTLLTQVVSGGD